eukprot:scaffold111188_cov62-Phaeocystis_antarctica.AAC.11
MSPTVNPCLNWQAVGGGDLVFGALGVRVARGRPPHSSFELCQSGGESMRFRPFGSSVAHRPRERSAECADAQQYKPQRVKAARHLKVARLWPYSFMSSFLAHAEMPNNRVFLKPLFDRSDLYGGGAGGSIGFSVRYQGELLGIWDLQNRDPRRKSPPETEKKVG